jgi:hypothetical protein
MAGIAVKPSADRGRQEEVTFDQGQTLNRNEPNDHRLFHRTAKVSAINTWTRQRKLRLRNRLQELNEVHCIELDPSTLQILGVFGNFDANFEREGVIDFGWH